MKKLLLIIVLALALFACGKNSWYQDGKTKADLNRDVAACEAKSKKGAASLSEGPLRDAKESKIFNECMRGNGWQRWTLTHELQ